MRKRNAQKTDTAFQIRVTDGPFEEIIVEEREKRKENFNERQFTDVQRLFKEVNERVSSNVANDDVYEICERMTAPKVMIRGDPKQIVWDQKQYFTELIDFIVNGGDIDMSLVSPEFRSLESVIDRLRTLRGINPDAYISCGIANTVFELFEFYAIRETATFSFKTRDSLINCDWIRAGWFWTEQDGDPDIVPQIFEKSLIQMLKDRLQRENLETEADFEVALAHCREIAGYSERTAKHLFPILRDKMKRVGLNLNLM